MPQKPDGDGGAPLSVPSMLDLVRLSPRLLFPPGGVALYRQIALLTDLSEGDEVLDVACGKGIPLEYFVREHGVVGSGVDIDARLVDMAEERTRREGIADRLQLQTGRSDALPYRDEIFDVTVGELGLAASCEPADAVRELVRVTRPGGSVVLVQLVWTAPVEEGRRRILSEHLGAKPLMLVEWKRLLKEAGLVDLHTEDWSDDETAFRPAVAKPFPDFAEIFSLSEKIGILRRAWSRWGWRGVRTVLEREREVHRLLSHERILALDLIRGRRPAGPAREESASAEDEGSVSEGEPRLGDGEATRQEVASERPDRERTGPPAGGARPGERSEPGEPDAEDEETAGLPLFGGGEGE